MTEELVLSYNIFPISYSSIRYFLCSEDAVVDMVKGFYDHIEDRDVPPYAMIDLRIRHIFGKPPDFVHFDKHIKLS